MFGCSKKENDGTILISGTTESASEQNKEENNDDNDDDSSTEDIPYNSPPATTHDNLTLPNFEKDDKKDGKTQKPTKSQSSSTKENKSNTSTTEEEKIKVTLTVKMDGKTKKYDLFCTHGNINIINLLKNTFDENDIPYEIDEKNNAFISIFGKSNADNSYWQIKINGKFAISLENYDLCENDEILLSYITY